MAAKSMTGSPLTQKDFFVAKSTMNFFNIPTMSLGEANPLCKAVPDISRTSPGTIRAESDDGNYTIDIEIDHKGNYKKIIHKEGKILGSLLQGDLSYSGILSQLIKKDIDVSRVKKPLFDIDYGDLFNITENLEFAYD